MNGFSDLVFLTTSKLSHHFVLTKQKFNKTQHLNQNTCKYLLTKKPEKPTFILT